MSDYKAIENITIDRGETFSLEFQVEPGGETLNLKDYLIYAQIRKSKSRLSDQIATFTVTVDDVEMPNTNPTESWVKIALDETETVAQEFYDNSEGWYDVLFVSPAGERVYYLAGRVNIEGTVSLVP